MSDKKEMEEKKTKRAGKARWMLNPPFFERQKRIALLARN